jgi:hypothetical protein
MVIVLDKKGFKLPRFDKEKFVSLLRLGIDYNRDLGLFSIKNFNNIDKITAAVSEILKSEVVFMQTCMVCGKSFGCEKCKYKANCATKNLPFTCVCPECLMHTV